MYEVGTAFNLEKYESLIISPNSRVAGHLYIYNHARATMQNRQSLYRDSCDKQMIAHILLSTNIIQGLFRNRFRC